MKELGRIIIGVYNGAIGWDVKGVLTGQQVSEALDSVAEMARDPNHQQTHDVFATKRMLRRLGLWRPT